MSDPAIDVRPAAGGARFDIRVVPRGSRDAISGVRDGALLVRVTAPPVDGAATEAVVRLVARALEVAPRQVAVVAGVTSRRKTLEISALDAPTVAARLSAILR